MFYGVQLEKFNKNYSPIEGFEFFMLLSVVIIQFLSYIYHKEAVKCKIVTGCFVRSDINWSAKMLARVYWLCIKLLFNSSYPNDYNFVIVEKINKVKEENSYQQCSNFAWTLIMRSFWNKSSLKEMRNTTNSFKFFFNF